MYEVFIIGAAMLRLYLERSWVHR